MFGFPSCSSNRKRENFSAVQCCTSFLPPFPSEAVDFLLWGWSHPTKLLLCCKGYLFLSSQDCLRKIQDFLKKHMDFVFSLLGIAIAFTVTLSVFSHFGPERQDPVRKKYPKVELERATNENQPSCLPTHCLAEVCHCNYLYIRALNMWWWAPEQSMCQETPFSTMKAGLICCDIFMLLPSWDDLSWLKVYLEIVLCLVSTLAQLWIRRFFSI